MITIPTISELRQQVQADLESTYGSSIPTFGKNFLRVLSAVQAAKLWLYYKAIAFLQKNIFVDTADSESNGGTLERFGRVKLNRNPFGAVAGQYIVEVTGTVGAIITAKTTFKTDEDSLSPNKLFILDAEFILASSPDQITLRALEAGTDSILDAGDGLTSTIPLASVDKGVTVVSEFITPLAAEDLEEYREKVIESYRTEPQGGAATDYRIWAEDAQGVAKVYPYASYGGNNEVDVYVEATTEDSTDGEGTPSSDLLDDVEAVIEFDPDDSKELNERGRRPLNVIVNVLPVTVKEVIITITGFTDLTAAKQTAIEDSLDELIAEIRPFIDGADVLADRNDRLDLNRIISKIYEAVPGCTFSSVTMTVSAVSVGSYVFEGGEIPHLDSVSIS